MAKCNQLTPLPFKGLKLLCMTRILYNGPLVAVNGWCMWWIWSRLTWVTWNDGDRTSWLLFVSESESESEWLQFVCGKYPSVIGSHCSIRLFGWHQRWLSHRVSSFCRFHSTCTNAVDLILATVVMSTARYWSVTPLTSNVCLFHSVE